MKCCHICNPCWFGLLVVIMVHIFEGKLYPDIRETYKDLRLLEISLKREHGFVAGLIVYKEAIDPKVSSCCTLETRRLGNKTMSCKTLLCVSKQIKASQI